jgi:peptidoglycan/LPS O-acetylase OafA/YrhL
MTHNRATTHRPEVDGLRAIAVLSVMFHHAGFKAFSGGFVGVDVFFVISGYLITAIILREYESGTFSALRFYERRMRRIVPALLAMIVGCIPLALMWLSASELREFAQSLVGIAASASEPVNENETFERIVYEGMRTIAV